jgi:superfamily II DNA or RNA helicase
VEQILAADYGLSVAYIDGETKNRSVILDDVKMGKYRAVTSVAVLTTGFDAPIIDCICFLRPTMSASLFLQMSGRGLRIAPGKDNLLIVDCAGNFERFGTLEEPLAPREPSKSKQEIEIPEREIEYIRCPTCCISLVSYAKACRYCGTILKAEAERTFCVESKDWHQVLLALIDDHTTKKGEKCKRITYILRRKMLGRFDKLHEYFMVDRGGWHLRKYYERERQIEHGIDSVKATKEENGFIKIHEVREK